MTRQRTAHPGRPLSSKADLHLHSTFSDGVKTPEELVKMIGKAQAGYVSLTDHDTTEGYAGLSGEYSFVLIPGVEVSTGDGGRTHVLGYGKAVFSGQMQAFLSQIRGGRVQRAERMLEKLVRCGLNIPSAVQSALLQNPGVGRPHIARALVALGVCSTVRQAFDQYLAQGRPGYVPRDLPATGEAIATMSRLGVCTVLAHPKEMNLDDGALEALAAEWKAQGLRGMECYHPSAKPNEAQALERMARRLGLLVTGGSDYHGDAGSTAHIAHLPSGWHKRHEDVLMLLEATQG